MLFVYVHLILMYIAHTESFIDEEPLFISPTKNTASHLYSLKEKGLIRTSRNIYRIVVHLQMLQRATNVRFVQTK